MNTYSILAVGTGAALGAYLRWFLGILLNPILPPLPLGTLAANMAGGYLIGLATAYFAASTALPPELRLFVVTGFLGGLTTFSTFSAEAMTLLSRSEYIWAALHIVTHLFGSLFMTALGIFTYTLLRESHM